MTGKCPVPITFLGFEVGVNVISGKNLDRDDHLFLAMKDFGCKNGRNSWDPMTVQLALIGDEEKAGFELIKGTASVDVDTGRNYFDIDENGLHGYVVKVKPDEYYSAKIDEAIKSS